ncbi:hypothetical protein L2E82_08337 [Cichorium intybus]|uniref:Uncharacterized protein n=1 Tax=Cichorium intybus TaxID=13427 RepID=A0ACB9G859_CICIN|nr:hypothetical protein L2E82_08337 [Cichorium intybus]
MEEDSRKRGGERLAGDWWLASFSHATVCLIVAGDDGVTGEESLVRGANLRQSNVGVIGLLGKASRVCDVVRVSPDLH